MEERKRVEVCAMCNTAGQCWHWQGACVCVGVLFQSWRAVDWCQRHRRFLDSGVAAACVRGALRRVGRTADRHRVMCTCARTEHTPIRHGPTAAAAAAAHFCLPASSPIERHFTDESSQFLMLLVRYMLQIVFYFFFFWSTALSHRSLSFGAQF